MTNKEAFLVYFQDDSRAEFVLNSKSIDPALSDKVAISGAYGMLEKCTEANWSQGRTSESLSAAARMQLIRQANQILKENGISLPSNNSTVGAITW